jgi:excisionase family DNA binding protein
MPEYTFEQVPAVLGEVVQNQREIAEQLSHISHRLPQEGDLTQGDVNEPMNVEQAAKFLKLSVKTIHTLASKGEIPYYKPAKHLLFFKSELIDWVKKSKRKTGYEIAEEVDNNLTSKAA